MSEEYRIEKDSMGEVRVPAEALYGAQTQRAGWRHKKLLTVNWTITFQ